MTLLDDHEPRYKLQGTQLAYQLLEIALPDLLRRTGIDILLQNVGPLFWVYMLPTDTL